MDLTMKMAKNHFHAGNISAFYFDRSPEGWAVYFVLKSTPMERSYLLDSRDQKIRVFRSLDAAVGAVEDVGFEVKRVQTC